MSIRKTLRKTLILFSILPILIISVVVFRLISDRMIKITSDNLQQLAETNSNGLEALIETQHTEVSLLASQSGIYRLVSGSNSNFHDDSMNNKETYKSISDLLIRRRRIYPYNLGITIYNADKKAIVSSNKSSEGITYDNSLTLAYMNATHATASGISGLIEYKSNGYSNYAIEIGCPILSTDDSATIRGYIISIINVAYFENFIDSIDMGESGFGMILDKNGNIIYHPDKKLIGSTSEANKLKELVKNYNSGNLKPTGIFYSFDKKGDSIYGYSVLPDLNWVLLIKQDVKEIVNLANVILYLLSFTVIALIMIIILASTAISKTFTSPLIELKEAMQIASDGNLEVQSNIRLKNEFGELANSFNKMIHIIKSNYYELKDIHSKLKTNEEELRKNYNYIEYLAYHDVLTSLPNKISFMDCVNNVLSSSFGCSQIHGVYFIDLDNFKTINDTLGHDYGDYLLTKTSERLQSLSGVDDILARAGGDEFMVFCENIGSEEQASNYAAKIIEAFQEPFDLNGEIAYVSMSIGIATYPKNGTSPKTLIKNADIAMYRSKDTGKNKFTLFTNSMEEELNRNALITDILRHAVKNQEIFIKYQPQYNINHNKITGFEALMRINSVKLGPLSPEEFIPIAEDSGLIVELGQWVLRESCRFTKSLIDQGYSPYTVSVNISSIQLNRSGFVAMLEEILEETELPPELLDLEITESSLVSSLIDATTLLSSVQALGVKISLDDFGTGYSSLNYLTSMPINTLKMDKSFIDNIIHNHKDACIADAIIQLAHSIQLNVIAEGVENEHQLSVLREKKCDIIQGFIFSKPLLPSALIRILTD